MAMPMATAQINKMIMKRIKAKAVELEVSYTMLIEYILDVGVDRKITKADVEKTRDILLKTVD